MEMEKNVEQLAAERPERSFRQAIHVVDEIILTSSSMKHWRYSIEASVSSSHRPRRLLTLMFRSSSNGGRADG